VRHAFAAESGGCTSPAECGEVAQGSRGSAFHPRQPGARSLPRYQDTAAQVEGSRRPAVALQLVKQRATDSVGLAESSDAERFAGVDVFHFSVPQVVCLGTLLFTYLWVCHLVVVS